MIIMKKKRDCDMREHRAPVARICSINLSSCIMLCVLFLAVFINSTALCRTVDLFHPPGGGLPDVWGTAPMGWQCLYLASEIGTTGQITQVYWWASGPTTAAQYPGTVITFRHTALGTLDAGGAAFSAGTIWGSAEVFNGTYSIAAGNGGMWIPIGISGNFTYNGVSNLILEVIRGGGTAANAWGVRTGPGRFVYSVTSPYDRRNLSGGIVLTVRLVFGDVGLDAKYRGGPYGAGGDSPKGSGKGGGGCFITSSWGDASSLVSVLFPESQLFGLDVSHIRMGKVVELSSHPFPQSRTQSGTVPTAKGIPIAAPIAIGVGLLVIPASVIVLRKIA